MMPDARSSSKPSRRGFLNAFVGTTFFAWLFSALYPVLRYLKPLPNVGPGGPAKLTRDELVKLEQEHFVIVPVSNRRVLVLKEAQKILAFDAKCTHEGCTVQYLPGEAIIWCACHNGRFDLDGRVLGGPPPRPLPKYTVERQEDGGVVIHPESKANV